MMDILGMPVILREIMQHLPHTELLQLSLVNKLWNREARSVLKNRGNVTTRINKSYACQNLRAFALNLRRMKASKRVVPISGLTIVLGGLQWSHGVWCKGSSAGKLDRVYEDIVDQMTWKHLALNFPWRWDACKNCPAFILIKKMFQKHWCNLEEISFYLDEKEEFFEQVLQDFSFPRLKILRIFKLNPPCVPGPIIRADDSLFIKTLVSKAPNLQVLYTEDRVDLKGNLLKGSSAVFVTDYEYSPCLDEIPEGVVGLLRMQRMRLQSICEDFSVARFNRITSAVLQNSRATLSSMEICAIFLVPLKRYRICLPNIRTLRVKFTESGLEMGQPDLLRLVKSFDFKRIFPNLSTVHIAWFFDCDFERIMSAFSDMLEEENDTFIEPMPDRAENIKNLNLEWAGILDYSTQFLVQVFPDIQKLSIADIEIPFARIWESWLYLKELHVTLRGFREVEKFDSVFCGIFPEEVDHLQMQGEEYLRRVNIVPVMPSITCLKSLRTFKLSFDEPRACRRQTDDPTFVFSKVTGLIAFQRNPALAVTVTTNDENREAAMSHLKPYASVVLRIVSRW